MRGSARTEYTPGISVFALGAYLDVVGDDAVSMIYGMTQVYLSICSCVCDLSFGIDLIRLNNHPILDSIGYCNAPQKIPALVG